MRNARPIPRERDHLSSRGETLIDPLTIRKNMNLSSMGTWNPAFIAERPTLSELLKVTPLPKIDEADPNGKDAHAPGAKLDARKLRPWLFTAGFANALEEVAKVTTIGAEKYTPNGWVEVERGQERYMEAFGRHMLAYAQGKEIDDGPKGTGCLHIAQMIWNLLAVLELQQRAKK